MSEQDPERERNQRKKNTNYIAPTEANLHTEEEYYIKRIDTM